MTSLRTLLDEEEAAWRELCGLFGQISGAAWERAHLGDGWTPKDLMAHIAAWHAVTTDRLECVRSTGDLPEGPDTDAFNAQEYERRKGDSLHDVQASFDSSHHRFREEAAALGPDIDERLAELIVANGRGHYAEHLSDLEAFVKENA